MSCIQQLLLFRYKRPADWELLSELAEQHPVPLIGNGDILTHYEVFGFSITLTNFYPWFLPPSRLSFVVG